MSSLLSKKVISNIFRKNFNLLPLHFDYNKYKYDPIYIQRRDYCFPVMMLGGSLGFFCLTQNWNPYFDRGLLNSLQNWSLGLSFIGFILPS